MGANNYHDVLQRLRNVLRTRGSRRELYIRDLELQLKQLFAEHAAEKQRIHRLKDNYVKKCLDLQKKLADIENENAKLRETQESTSVARKDKVKSSPSLFVVESTDGSDPTAKLGASMAVALITTLYGSIFANFIFFGNLNLTNRVIISNS